METRVWGKNFVKVDTDFDRRFFELLYLLKIPYHTTLRCPVRTLIHANYKIEYLFYQFGRVF